MEKFTIELLENEIKEFIKLQADFSKTLNLFKKLEDDIKAYKPFEKMEKKIFLIYENFEHIGQLLFQFTNEKFPEKLIPNSWKLKMMEKYLDRQEYEK